jgi:hypothetical protein
MSVVVKRLTVRVTGVAPDAAARIATDVARDLAQRLASGTRVRSHGVVRVQVGPDRDRIAAAVARSLR